MWTADWILNTQSAPHPPPPTPPGIEYKDYVLKLKLGQLTQRYRQNLFATLETILRGMVPKCIPQYFWYWIVTSASER